MQPTQRSRVRLTVTAMLALTIASIAIPSHAQLRLPGGGWQLPQRIGPLDTERLRRPDSLLREIDLPELRLENVKQLLRRHRDVLEADPRGNPAVRGVILAWSPNEAALRESGLAIVRREQLDGLDETLVTLRVPAGADTDAVLTRLRERDPDGSYDYNHLYSGSGSGPARLAKAAGSDTSAPVSVPGIDAAATPAVGLIDSGVDAGHPAFRTTSMQRWGCGNLTHPSLHGSAVAALMVGKTAQFQGVAPQARLYAADIYCNSPIGGAADTIALALAWMAREQVPVINMSIVGPANRALERAVAALQKRGHVVVAAVGNDGPAAPPLYPASYAGVVGVSAVDKRNRVLPEAGRGAQVMFAAPGSHMVSAAPGEPAFRTVRGTSFAAPIVAAMLAQLHARPDVHSARRAVAALAEQASGAVPNETGLGIVGTLFRTAP